MLPDYDVIFHFFLRRRIIQTGFSWEYEYFKYSLIRFYYRSEELIKTKVSITIACFKAI